MPSRIHCQGFAATGNPSSNNFSIFVTQIGVIYEYSSQKAFPSILDVPNGPWIPDGLSSDSVGIEWIPGWPNIAVAGRQEDNTLFVFYQTNPMEIRAITTYKTGQWYAYPKVIATGIDIGSPLSACELRTESGEFLGISVYYIDQNQNLTQRYFNGNDWTDATVIHSDTGSPLTCQGFAATGNPCSNNFSIFVAQNGVIQEYSSQRAFPSILDVPNGPWIPDGLNSRSIGIEDIVTKTQIAVAGRRDDNTLFVFYQTPNTEVRALTTYKSGQWYAYPKVITAAIAHPSISAHELRTESGEFLGISVYYIDQNLNLTQRYFDGKDWTDASEVQYAS